MKKILLVAGLVGSGDIPKIIIKNLIELGYEVNLLPVDENLPYLENYLHKSGKRFSKLNLYLFSKRLYKKTKTFLPDILFIYGSNWAVLPEMLGKIKKDFKCKVVLWEGNMQFWRWFQSEALRYYDYIFASDSYAIPILKGPAGLNNVFHFPGNVCDPDIHRPLDMTEEEKEHYGSDIGFIGVGRPDRIEFFENLTDFDLKLWGVRWDKSEKLKPFFIDEPVKMDEKIKIYQSAKINVNIHSSLCQIDGISAKIFEIASCGGFFLTERKKDLFLFFKEEEDLISFSNIDELREKIKHYLSHPEEREELARRIRTKVINNYTYKHKLKEMMSRMGY
jgi:spore maturation protein CgeB